MSSGVGERQIVLRVEDGASGRLDSYLASRLSPEVSRSRIQELIEQGNVLRNGAHCKPSARIRPGDIIEVRIPAPVSWDVVPQDIPLDVVYEDEELLVLNKPRGMVVHPAAGHYDGTIVNAILNRCPDLQGIGGEVRPGIVHRLDKDTTGLMVVAKTEHALRCLQQQIKERKARRQYIALCRGFVPSDEGTVEAPIGRHPVNRKKMAVVQGGRLAVTDYRVLTRFGRDYTLLMASLRTGRTHQIRVHLSHLGHPVVGDPVYGKSQGELGLEGQALHAFKLGLYKPSTGKYMEFTAPLPADFRNALEILRDRYKEALPEWLI